MERFQNQIFKLWINHEFYIPVDSEGHCMGKYYEGAMGLIIEIIRFDGGSHALKIPWLMADTLRENAYVSELLSEERSSVMQIFSDGQNTASLMQAEVFGATVLQKRIQTRDARPEAREFHDAIVAVKFNKGKSPQFCAIHAKKKNQKKTKIFPSTITDCPFTDEETFDHAYQEAKSNDTDWEKTVVVHNGKDKSIPGVYRLCESLEPNENENIWYIGVPAVVYVWGTLTMHEAITGGYMAEWHLADHLVLMERVINSVRCLHRRGFLHSDIRPANLMAKGDCKDPENYFLIDYAGYNIGLLNDNRPIEAHAESNNPIFLGPAIGGERNSPFYAPERKKGIEKEGADIVVILDRKDHYLILFGWRSYLLNNSACKIDEEILAELKMFQFEDNLSQLDIYGNTETKLKEDDLLLPGDRLQIREYVFNIESIGTLKGKLEGEQVYKCSKRFWRVYHGRIVVKNDEPFEQQWMAIPRIIELRQWAVGTDCFGIGALFIYSLFRMHGDAAVESKVSEEIAFQRLLDELSNPHYLDIIWYELSRICTQLSICHSQYRNIEDIKQIVFDPDKYWEQKSRGSGDDKGKTIDEFAIHTANLIIQTAPDSRVILKNVNYNYVHFLYIIYFSLCCLHRQQNMNESLLQEDPQPTGDIKDKVFLPFCKSRTTIPGFNGGEEESPIDNTLAFFKKFKRIIESNYFDKLQMDLDDSEGPENVPAPILRREISNLKKDIKRSRIEKEQLQQQNLDLERKIEGFENMLIKINRKINSIDYFAQKMNKKKFYSPRQFKALVEEINYLKNESRN